jgi:hypothetical protein
MQGKYAYSYDREDFTGAYDSPEQALADAVQKAEGLPSPPTEIYVGMIAEADPQAADHAQAIVHTMNRRAHLDCGDSAANYLRDVTPPELKELDDAIAPAILGWLRKHDLMPRFVRIRGIREYPVPFPGQPTPPSSDADEVNEIGPAEQPGDLTGL